MRATREELRAVRDELRNKAVLLDGARREASEVASFIERLTEECHGLQSDLQRQETLVVQSDGAIASLRDEACIQWASGWLAFQRKAASAYPGLDLNFDIPSDEEAEDSFSVDSFGEPNTLAEARSLLMTSELPYITLLSFFLFFIFYFTQGFEPRIYVLSFSINTPIFYFIAFIFFFFLFITAPLILLCLSYLGSMAIWPCLS